MFVWRQRRASQDKPGEEKATAEVCGDSGAVSPGAVAAGAERTKGPRDSEH